MSHWDFGRPPTGPHDAPGPAGQGNAADPDDALAPDDPWTAGFARTPDDSEATGNGWGGRDGSLADGGWPADDPWPAESGWTRDDPWPAGSSLAGIGLAGLGPADEEEGESTAPYPITYERDAFTAAVAR